MKRLVYTLSVLTLGALLGSSTPVRGQTSAALPPVGGAVLTADTKTLIVSFPSSGKLAYYDTTSGKELKKVEVDFQPTLLAIQGNKLFAATKGAPTIHIIDVTTGKETKEIKTGGEPLESLGCHPTKGLLYAVSKSYTIFSIHPENGEVTKTQAKGQMLAVDANEGFIYTGIQKPTKDVMIVEQGKGGSMRISFATANARAIMLKYAVDGNDLKVVAANDNGAVNGRGMAVSPDGKKIAMAGGGGWRSKTDPKANYAIAVFDTSDMQTLLGQVDTGAYPSTLAFHPYLNLGVAVRLGGNSELILFNAKSFARKTSTKVDDSGATGLLFFADHGTKLIYITSPGFNPNGKSMLYFIPLELTDQDRETLKKAYPK